MKLGTLPRSDCVRWSVTARLHSGIRNQRPRSTRLRTSVTGKPSQHLPTMRTRTRGWYKTSCVPRRAAREDLALSRFGHPLRPLLDCRRPGPEPPLLFGPLVPRPAVLHVAQPAATKSLLSVILKTLAAKERWMPGQWTLMGTKGSPRDKPGLQLFSPPTERTTERREARQCLRNSPPPSKVVMTMIYLTSKMSPVPYRALHRQVELYSTVGLNPSIQNMAVSSQAQN